MNTLHTAVRPLLTWYDSHARILPWRDDPTPYTVWISEIMLQQTRVETARSYFERFISQLPDIASLSQASENTLYKLWEGLGYYSRVRNLQKAARVITEKFNGILPSSYENLLSLPGIGPYTAGAIASIAFGLPCPAVDGNVLRVISRFTASYEPISSSAVKRKIEQTIRDILPANRPGDFNQALMELGATICLPGANPKCTKCPLQSNCEGYLQQVADELPIKKEKKQKKIESKTIFVICCNSTLAICKYPSGGLLSGLWGLPSVDGEISLIDAPDILLNWGISNAQIRPLPSAKHIFTHIEWHMTGFWADISQIPLDSSFSWASASEITEVYALPSAMRAYKNAFLTLNK